MTARAGSATPAFMTTVVMPDGVSVEQGGPEDRATWWTCERCGFNGPNVGETTGGGQRRCRGSCGGVWDNPNVPRLPGHAPKRPPREESGYAGFGWIKVGRYVDLGPSASWEQRYRALEKHHEAETAFLVAEVRRLAARTDPSEAAVVRCMSVVEAEPELPGDVPQEVLDAVAADPVGVMRVLVVSTKGSILRSLHALLDETRS